jgi:type 1 glutamine amidotransferase
MLGMMMCFPIGPVCLIAMPLPKYFVVVCLLCACLPCTSAVADSPKPHVVMLIAEREYQTDETLPAFAKQHLDADYRSTFVFADPQDANHLVGIDAIKSADVLVVSVRRRTLTKEQLDVIRNYVAAGKPVIGIRTASHAFCLRNKPPPDGRAAWPEFDQQVFGGNYSNHYGNSLKATVTLANGSPEHSATLLYGLESTKPFLAGGSLYQVSPLASGTSTLLTGRVEGQSPEPVAWTFRRADGGKSFYTSLGHVDDFRGDVLPRLMVNAIVWSLQSSPEK